MTASAEARVRAASASTTPAPSASVVDGRSVAARRRKAAASRRVVNSGSLWMSAEYQRKTGWSAAETDRRDAHGGDRHEPRGKRQSEETEKRLPAEPRLRAGGREQRGPIPDRTRPSRASSSPRPRSGRHRRRRSGGDRRTTRGI